MVNYIVNYNSLKKDIKYLEKKINLDIGKYYLRTKNHTRKGKIHYSKMLTLKQKMRIYNDSKTEFNIMKYKK